MLNPRLATRYAKSLIDLSNEMGCLETSLADMQLIEHVCNISADFRNMLRSPIITSEKKIAVIDEILGKNISDLTRRFIHLLIVKGRELNLGEISTAFVTQYNILKHVTTVKITTAVAIDGKLRDSIIAKISTMLPGNTIDLKSNVNADLIGGFVVEVEDKLYDASIRKRLADVRSSVVDTSYVQKM